jgi:hypothetical protein
MERSRRSPCVCVRRWIAVGGLVAALAASSATLVVTAQAAVPATGRAACANAWNSGADRGWQRVLGKLDVTTALVDVRAWDRDTQDLQCTIVFWAHVKKATVPLKVPVLERRGYPTLPRSTAASTLLRTSRPTGSTYYRSNAHLRRGASTLLGLSPAISKGRVIN